MSKEKFVEIPIPKEDYDNLNKMAKEAGYRSASEFATAAVLQALARAYGRKDRQPNAKELLQKYTEAKAKNPCLTFPDFLDTIL